MTYNSVKIISNYTELQGVNNYIQDDEGNKYYFSSIYKRQLMMEEENNSTMIGIDNDIEVEFAIVNKRDSFEFVEICDNFIYDNVNHIYTFGRYNYIYNRQYRKIFKSFRNQ